MDIMEFLKPPSIPPWNAAHVILVHFPIALLVFTPFLLLLAFLFRSMSRAFAVSAGILLICGTIAAQVAVMSGGAAEDLLKAQGINSEDADPAMKEALHEHEEGGELVRNIYVALSVLFLIYLLAPAVRNDSIGPAANAGLLFLFLVLTGLGALIVANTAHLG